MDVQAFRREQMLASGLLRAGAAVAPPRPIVIKPLPKPGVEAKPAPIRAESPARG